MSRYRIEKLSALPTSEDVKSLCAALEDCFSSAADISICDKSSFFQYQDIMEEFNNRHERLSKAYFDSFETISMFAGQSNIGKRFEEADKISGSGIDRTWYKQAYMAVKDKTLTKSLLRKNKFGF